MTSLFCPLCSLALSLSSLEAHLRQELDYPAIRCRLCRLTFHSEARARKHFSGPLASHPAQSLQLSCLEEEPEKEHRLEELVRLAKGGQREVEKRLCVCGQCQLLCREDFRPASGHVKDSGPQIYEAQRHRAPSLQAETLSYDETTKPQAWRPNPVQGDPQVPQEPDEALREDPAEAQPMPEASEAEDQMPMDVKPDLADLKPQLSTDGKVACIQCGLRVGKDQFKKHALGAHSSVRPFNCNLCPHNEKTKGELSKHQRKEHGAQLSGDTFTFAGSETLLGDLVEQCFGAAKDADWARLRCGPCDKLVNKMSLKNHVATRHLQKALHSCKLCDFTSRDISAGDANKHVMKVHKERPGPETLDSSQALHFLPVIKNMIPQFFSGN